jgi:hypothetical protein
MPSSRVNLEKLTVPQLVKKLPEFYGTLESIIMFNSLTLVSAVSYINPVHTLPVLVICIQILSSHLSLGGHTVAQMVETLHYKPEGPGFDSQWCHWNFS